MDFSDAEREMLVRSFSGTYCSRYKRYAGPACNLDGLALAGIRLGDTQKTIRMILGQPFAKRSIQHNKIVNSQLLYKDYPVDTHYPCTVFLNLDKGRLTYAAFDFPGERPAENHLDPGFLALFETNILFLMLEAEKIITTGGTLEMRYDNGHLIIDHHHGCLKVRMLQQQAYSDTNMYQ